MATITRFEDLDCWKSARQLVKLAIAASEEGKLAKDISLRSQFLRAAVSVMNNIADGFDRSSTRDSIKYYDISHCSANEVKSMTYVFEDSDYIPLQKITELREKSEQAKALTLGLIRYLRRKAPRRK